MYTCSVFFVNSRGPSWCSIYRKCFKPHVHCCFPISMHGVLSKRELKLLYIYKVLGSLLRPQIAKYNIPLTKVLVCMITNAVRGSSQNCISKLQLYELPLHTQWWLQTTMWLRNIISLDVLVYIHTTVLAVSY